MKDLLREILCSRVYDVARETPLEAAPKLSARLGREVLFKREDLQQVFSFKLRGAYNRIAQLSSEERQRGVIAASAGNHAQGVARSAQFLGIRARIVMPRTTPEIKVQAVRALGAEVVLFGDSYSDAQAHCQQLIAETGMVFIHPFDDPLVIAGQGTVGAEILRQRGTGLDAVFVPVGGGGLISGVAAYLKSIVPEIRIIGVEPFEADAMYQSLAAGERIELEQVGIFADGVAVRRVGEHTFALCQQYVDRIVRVSNDEICAAIKDVFDETRTVMEPAGALAVAGLKRMALEDGEATRHGAWAAILSGANMNFDRLRFIAERAEIGEAREALFAVTIPERPGAFRSFCAAIGGQRTITEFNYRLHRRDEAHIFVGVAVQNREDAQQLLAGLRAAGHRAMDLSDDEMAKLHIRHMVGGHAQQARHERIFRFEFPERPGALMEFLDKVGGRWNISLFHYRNNGVDFDRVLAGFEVPDEDDAEFRAMLDRIALPYAEETASPAYRFFLGPGEEQPARLRVAGEHQA
ncbi:threonine ammonia-lyase, biosynthetic [Candidatus Igneacidithiobacillus taiwanensis]|uniref:threonine ammonia-lyase, biosynthetic n=1 Tax=Candidatus Igneacidithiobacillus taiwanensis TaxID=1945924 RepID=UPI0028A01928|nr:threonine ammonia-lyase, biosynthetic [Candidatus Igneacidithiobacillus taiwanensis]MCE5361047.1 threonine ammonia-lyase, biosynthetic [Acidithiobacillus sp.]